MKSNQTIAVALLVEISFLAGVARAQQISGSITGVVQDPQARVVPNARVMLINQSQGVTAMQMITSPEGTFVFTPLLPATYTVTVEAPGFKKYSRTDIPLDANQRLGLPPIALEVGSPTEAITVEANAVALETVSATRSGVVGQSQVNDLAMNGRNFGAVMRIVPGVENDVSTANGQVIGGQRSDQHRPCLGRTCTACWGRLGGGPVINDHGVANINH